MEPTSGRSPRTGEASLPRVVLVDDAVEVRTLIRARLRLSRAVEVAGEGANGQEAIELAERLQPDLMVLDLSMPGMDGLEALPRIREVAPTCRVAMYSGFAEAGLADKAIEAGAAAFIEKSASLDELARDLLKILADRPEIADTAQGSGATAVDTSTPLDEWVGTDSVEPVLRQHLERFREVFEDAAIGMATMTLAGRVVRANASLARLTGRSVGDLVSTPLQELAAGSDSEAMDALRLVATGTRDTVQVEHDALDHPARRLLTTLSPVRDAAQRPLYLFVQVQDISGQREAEARLRRSEQRFRLLVEAVQDYAIFMLDRDGLVESWNAGAQRIKGWTAAEIVGRHFRTFYPQELQDARHPEHELQLATRDGRYEEEGWRVRKDGSQFWAQVTITAVRDEEGELIGFAKVTRDVTERRRASEQQDEAARALALANEQLAAANARLEQVAEDQAQFLALTAHELRSPVSVLGGTADLLGEHWHDVEPDRRGELFGALSTGASRLHRLLDDLLTVSRVRSSALEVKLREVDLREELSRILRDTGLAGDGADVRVSLTPGVRVLADVDRLTQVVDNLLRNGLLHGSPPVTLAVESTDAGAVDLIVTDAGSGVPERIRPRLFERFATNSRSGNGLGLYIVRSLARAQGGDARYREEDGAFVVRLRAAASTQEP